MSSINVEKTLRSFFKGFRMRYKSISNALEDTLGFFLGPIILPFALIATVLSGIMLILAVVFSVFDFCIRSKPTRDRNHSDPILFGFPSFFIGCIKLSFITGDLDPLFTTPS